MIALLASEFSGRLVREEMARAAAWRSRDNRRSSIDW